MASTIYEQADAAFSRVSAYVVALDGERVATVAFKFPADGAGRLYAYVHWLGAEMVRGHAGGYGYDKRTAACASAGQKLATTPIASGAENPLRTPAAQEFMRSISIDGGKYWDDCLRDAGFQVWQAC